METQKLEPIRLKRIPSTNEQPARLIRKDLLFEPKQMETNPSFLSPKPRPRTGKKKVRKAKENTEKVASPRF
jgi:hypothetical protein